MPLEGIEPDDLFPVTDSILLHEITSSGSHRKTAERSLYHCFDSRGKQRAGRALAGCYEQIDGHSKESMPELTGPARYQHWMGG